MPEQLPLELAENLRLFTTTDAVDDYSVYRLDPEEKYLFAKYYRPSDRILDLACGLGRTTLRLHEMGFPVRGIDTSEVFINTARKRFPYLDLRVGSYACIEEPDSTYSHVLISFNGLDYAYPESQRITALRECVRVLRSGGTLIYSSHNIKSLHPFSRCDPGRLRWRVRNSLKAFKPQAYVLEDGFHIYYASPAFVIEQAETVGFKFVEMIGFRMSTNWWFNTYFSPYIHYAFTKPADQRPDRSARRDL